MLIAQGSADSLVRAIVDSALVAKGVATAATAAFPQLAPDLKAVALAMVVPPVYHALEWLTKKVLNSQAVSFWEDNSGLINSVAVLALGFVSGKYAGLSGVLSLLVGAGGAGGRQMLSKVAASVMTSTKGGNAAGSAAATAGTVAILFGLFAMPTFSLSHFHYDAGALAHQEQLGHAQAGSTRAFVGIHYVATDHLVARGDLFWPFRNVGGTGVQQYLGAPGGEAALFVTY
jgi:hypothetical protein